MFNSLCPILTFVIIYKLLIITTGLSCRSKEERRRKCHHKLQQRERRKEVRRLYWKDLIKIELSTILSLAWFIQMELIRTFQVPSYFTLPQMQKVPTLQSDITKQASSVYNDMYRDRKSSQFILCDTENVHLEGRIGYVDWFDETIVKYHVLVCRKGFSDYENTVPMTLKPENMEAVVIVNEHKYNKEAKQEHSIVGVKKFLPNKSDEIFGVKVRHDAFSYICKIHERPEKDSNEAYSTMMKILSEKEEKEREIEKDIARQKDEYARCMDSFFSSHKPVEIRPRKSQKTNRNEKSEEHKSKDRAVWKAKLEHIRDSMTKITDGGEEHLFTFPFSTNDNSLISCAEGLVEFNEHRIEGEHHDVSLANRMEMEPIVVTTTSIKSLSPGISMNEDILNFCIKW